MNRFLAVVFSVFLTVLQVTVTPELKIGWINYNFALVCIVIVCLLCGGKTGIVNAFFVALVYDSFASFYPGTYLIAFLFVALIVEIIAKRMFDVKVLIAVFFVFAVTLITELIVFWFFYALNGMAYNAFALSKIIFPQCFINSAAALVVYWIYKFVFKLKRN